MKFIKSYRIKGKKILTPLGYKEIEYIHKTIPYEKYLIKTENGYILECAEKHVLIDKDYNEVYAKDSLGIEVITETGISKVSECIDLGYKQCMYDISIKEDTELYFSNGILSHNSGKSVTVAIFMCWHFNFNHDLNIGICANKGSLAREFLNNVKEMFYSMPMWLRQGVTAWTKSSIESELKMRILTDVPGENAFRGFSCLSGDSEIEVYDTFRNTNIIIELEKLYKIFSPKYLIKTKNGFQKFLGIQKSLEHNGLRITFNDNTEVKCTKTHRIESENGFVLAKDIKVNDVFNGKTVVKIEPFQGDFYDPIEVENGNTYTYNDLEHHNCSVICMDECISENSIITVSNGVDIKTISIKDLYKFKKYNQVLTSNGFKDFDDVVFKGQKKGLIIKTKNHSISVTDNHKFYINGSFVYARDLKIKDKIQTDNGLEEITEILESHDSYYDLINVSDGHHFTANGIEVSNCAWVPANKFNSTMDAILPAQSAMSWKKNIFISTPNGMNHFYDLVMGSRKRKVLYDLSESDISKLKDKVLSKKDNGNGLFDVTIDKPSNNMALFEMDWQDVPRYNSKGQRITPNEFKDDIVAKNGLIFFSQNYACVDFFTNVYVYDTLNDEYKEIAIGELYKELYA